MSAARLGATSPPGHRATVDLAAGKERDRIKPHERARGHARIQVPPQCCVKVGVWRSPSVTRDEECHQFLSVIHICHDHDCLRDGRMPIAGELDVSQRHRHSRVLDTRTATAAKLNESGWINTSEVSRATEPLARDEWVIHERLAGQIGQAKVLPGMSLASKVNLPLTALRQALKRVI